MSIVLDFLKSKRDLSPFSFGFKYNSVVNMPLSISEQTTIKPTNDMPDLLTF